ncbi:hypothetical protein EXIGLDRAFT_718495 [Exidia glandulosa HHB12029]|uniref:Cyanovirin-N domain-containing protein n=1 Tax=Exidia glandulosa HHB12029 TaxID=1314781 RepID=A0A165NXN5_EXIGL|nr:hypothetical protein EXIGLDRAFT_718495 [Exidia glandulosa HHB12029]
MRLHILPLVISLAAVRVHGALTSAGCSDFSLARDESDWQFSSSCGGGTAKFPLSACVGNINGVLTCGKYFMGASCKDCSLAGSVLSCACTTNAYTAQTSTVDLDGCLSPDPTGSLQCHA